MSAWNRDASHEAHVQPKVKTKKDDRQKKTRSYRPVDSERR
jgi:hypothetical protein